GDEAAEECGGSGPGQAPPQCLLTSAVSTVSATKSGRVRLLVRSTAVSPITVDIDYRLQGGKGSLTIPGGKERFGKGGIYRETTKLTASRLAKAMAAKSATLRLRPLGAPKYCHHFEETHLTVRHSSHGRLTWSEPEARRRSGRAS